MTHAIHTWNPADRGHQADADEPFDEVERDVLPSMEDPSAIPPDPSPAQQASDSAPNLLLDDPLEAVLAEAIVEQVELDPLDALFNEVMASEKLTREMKGKRKRLATGGYDDLSPAERTKLREQIQEWEAREEWTALACVAVLTEQKCKHCQATTRTIDGLYERQLSRKPEGGTRLILWSPQFLDGQLARLPRELLLRPREVAVCSACLLDRGFTKEADVVSW